MPALKIARAPIAGRAGGPRSALVNPLVGPPGVTLGDALGSISKGFDDLAEANHQDDVARDNVRAVQVEGEFQRRVDEGLSKLDPLGANYMDEVQDLLNTEREAAAAEAGFLTTDIATITERRLTTRVENQRLLAQQGRRDAIEKVAMTERRQRMDEALTNIRNDPDAVGLYITQFTQDLLRLNEGIGATERQKFADEFTDAAIIAQVEGLALAGRIGEAQALADLEEKSLSPKQFRALKKRIRSIESQVKADNKVENAGEIADVEIAILNEPDAAKARLIVEDAVARGIYAENRGKQVVAERMVVAMEEEQRKLQEEMATILLKLPTGLDTPEEADILWRARVVNEAPRLALLDPTAQEAAMLEMGAHFAAETGQLPTPFRRVIQNAEHMEDPQVLARAARYYDTIRKAAPAVNIGAGDRSKHVSAAVELLGLTYDNAAQMAIQRFPDPKVLEFRIKEFDKVNEDFVATKDMAKIFDVDDVQIPTEAAIIYERTFRLAFNQSGDIATAQEVAARTMKERFAVTHVGTPDNGYVTEWAPEMFFPGVSASSLTQTQKAFVITADAQRGLDSLGIKRAIVEGAEDNTSTLQFVVTDRTRRQIAAGERPEYDVYLLNSLNIPEKTAMTYVMPTTELLMAIPQYRAIAEAAMVAAADARARKATRDQPLSGSEGPDASSGVQTPGLPPGPPAIKRTLPTQGLPPGAEGVLTGVGGA